MYPFLVEVWCDGKQIEYRGFMDIESAEEYADRMVDRLKKAADCDYSVHIYASAE